jgi:predicted Zn-dependent protease
LIIIVALLASMSLVLPNAGAGHRFAGHWRAAVTPFNVRFIDSATKSWSGVMQSAADEWSKSGVLNAVIEPGAADRAVRICNYGYGNTGWVGYTVAVVKNKHFVRVAIKLNSTYLGRRNRKVMCHEMGHGLGLGHRSTTSSCMKQGSASKTPDRHDYRMLERIYGHAHAASFASSADTSTTTSDDGKTKVIRIRYPVEAMRR